MAKALGPESFGILNYSTALVALFLAGASFGLDNPVILRLVAGATVSRILGTAMLIRLCSAMFCTVAGSILVWQLEGQQASLVFWINVLQLLSILVTVPGTAELWFRSRTDTLWPAMLRSSAVLVSSVIKLLLVYHHAELKWYAVAFTLEAAIWSVGLFIAYCAKSRDARPLIGVDLGAAKGMVKDAMPFLISAFSVIIYMKIDAVMLGNMVSHHENGIYAVSQKFTEILYIVPVVLADTFYPTLIRKHRDDPGKFAGVFQQFMDGVLLTSALAIVVSLVLVGPVIQWFFGSKYEASIGIFLINAWACIPVTLSCLRNKWLAIHGMQRYESWSTVVGALTNVTLNLVMIPKWGAYGAAIASLISYSVAGVLTSLLLPNIRAVGIQQIKALWPFFRLYAALRHYRNQGKVTA